MPVKLLACSPVSECASLSLSFRMMLRRSRGSAGCSGSGSAGATAAHQHIFYHTPNQGARKPTQAQVRADHRLDLRHVTRKGSIPPCAASACDEPSGVMRLEAEPTGLMY